MTERTALSQRSAMLAVLAATAIGLALRLPGMWTDFWLDEIWTANLAARLDSASQVFTGIHHSNNHHLNTLLVYWLGDREDWAAYRVVALVTGTACIPLAAAILWSRGRLEALLGASLIAACFALVHFSSEARGSGPTVACALLALWLLERDLARPRLATLLGFGASVVAGFLFQWLFCFFWAGAVVQSGWVLWRRRPDPMAWLRGMLRLHFAPLLALGALWALDLRHLQVGLGEPLDRAWLLARITGSALGLPLAAGWAWPAGLAAAGLLAAGLLQRARRGDALGLNLAITIVIAPAVVIAWYQPAVLAVRYFLIGIAGTLLLCACLAAAALRDGGWRRALAILGLAVFALGNGIHIARFAELGRGGYVAALDRMQAATQAAEVAVGSDHDFRVGSVLEFHARRRPEAARFRYLRESEWPAGGPEWVVLHRQELGAGAAPFMGTRDGRFALVDVFDHAALSGYTWLLYRNTRHAHGGEPGSPPP